MRSLHSLPSSGVWNLKFSLLFDFLSSHTLNSHTISSINAFLSRGLPCISNILFAQGFRAKAIIAIGAKLPYKPYGGFCKTENLSSKLNGRLLSAYLMILCTLSYTTLNGWFSGTSSFHSMLSSKHSCTRYCIGRI